jgi:hypothetical protein
MCTQTRTHAHKHARTHTNTHGRAHTGTRRVGFLIAREADVEVILLVNNVGKRKNDEACATCGQRVSSGVLPMRRESRGAATTPPAAASDDESPYSLPRARA